MGSGDIMVTLNQLADALGVPPPPPINPDELTSGDSVISWLLQALGMAGNMGDPEDAAEALANQAEREGQIGEALSQFPANEGQSAEAMQQVMGMAQQIPQTISGLGQSLGSGGGGGIFQQIGQLFQQGMQAGQQVADVGGTAEVAEPIADALGDTLGAGGGLLGDTLGSSGLAGTAPASYLGPPVTPSPATFPASGSTPPPPPPPEPSGTARGGMGGYPMMPPGAAAGTPGSTDTKADTKRVVPPAVRNGAPVQGRISTPPSLPEVTKRVDGRQVANRRRALSPGEKPDQDTGADR